LNDTIVVTKLISDTQIRIVKEHTTHSHNTEISTENYLSKFVLLMKNEVP